MSTTARPAGPPAVPGLALVALDAVPPQPWRNGGGATRELLRGPAPAGPGDDGWSWRLSVATIAADGPFSAFPGVRRWFAVLDGDGVELRWADGCVRRLFPGDDALAFDGGDAPGCTLVGGATEDLNLMRRGETDGAAAGDGLVRLHAGAAWQPQGRWHGVYAHTALRLRIDDQAPQPIPPRTLAWLDRGADAAAPAVWRCDAAEPGAPCRAYGWQIADPFPPAAETDR